MRTQLRVTRLWKMEFWPLLTTKSNNRKRDRSVGFEMVGFMEDHKRERKISY